MWPCLIAFWLKGFCLRHFRFAQDPTIGRTSWFATTRYSRGIGRTLCGSYAWQLLFPFLPSSQRSSFSPSVYLPKGDLPSHNIFLIGGCSWSSRFDCWFTLFDILFIFRFLPMSHFKDELRREGFLEDLAALPSLSVDGVPSTTGGWMIGAFLVLVELAQEWQVRKKRHTFCFLND
jgi:hypothetical protein